MLDALLSSFLIALLVPSMLCLYLEKYATSNQRGTYFKRTSSLSMYFEKNYISTLDAASGKFYSFPCLYAVYLAYT